MSEEYPVIIDSKTVGTLTVTHAGLTTEFLARCSDPGRLIRLSVYGEGGEGYLGVMEPMGGALTLCRRLSRAAMARFPEPIAYASEAGAEHAPAPAPVPPREEKPPPRRDRSRGGGQTDLLWYAVGDGSLFTVSGGRGYRAIPMAAWGLPLERAVEKRLIDGVEYAVFPLEEGRI